MKDSLYGLTISIATHNGHTYLHRCLQSLQDAKVTNPVKVIDMASDSEASIDYLKEISSRPSYDLDLQVCYTGKNHFETGAILYTFKEFPSDSYLFLQDSVSIKSPYFFEMLYSKLRPGNVVPLVTFPSNFYDSTQQYAFCLNNFGSTNFTKGIFGSIFACMHQDMERLSLDKIPSIDTKFKSCAMERGWSVLFEQARIYINPIEGSYSYWALLEDKYTTFTKTFGNRN